MRCLSVLCNALCVASLVGQSFAQDDCTSTCADFDDNGRVNVADLLLVLASFDIDDGGDSNGDGITNVRNAKMQMPSTILYSCEFNTLPLTGAGFAEFAFLIRHWVQQRLW
jgi:hypothetical protein